MRATLSGEFVCLRYNLAPAGPLNPDVQTRDEDDA
jgi:hypothetical protein